MWGYTCLALLLELYFLTGSTRCEISEIKGPTFTTEPPILLDFSNVTGARLDCAARGIPLPSIQWIRLDGSPVIGVPRLLTVMPNGSLTFMPFRAESYRQDIHASTYRCVASNSAGTIISRSVRVRGVVKQFYEVQVYDEFVIIGNTAVLKCHVPSFVRDHVEVTAWIRDDSTVFTRSISENDRFTVALSGDLHIRETSKTDGQRKYICKTEHRLTGEVRLSPPGQLIVTDLQSSVPPRIINTSPMIQGKEKQAVELSCIAQAFPVPSYRWIKYSNKDKHSLDSGGRIKEQNNFLVIQDTTIEDSGLYTCVVNNSVGEERVEIVLTITADLTARVQPQQQIANIGGTAMLNCVISGHPVHSVTWVKDGQPLQTNSRIQYLSKDILRINNVARDDRGMYQCLVSNDEQSAQGSAELAIGDAIPEFKETFGEMTIKQSQFLSVRCIVSSNPPVQVTWSLDDAEIPANKRFEISTVTSGGGDVIGTLNVTEARVEDGGMYTCTASNRIGNASNSARVNVWGPPYIRPIANATVIAGAGITIKCPVTGYPIDAISWERETRALPINLRQIILPNGTFVLENAEKLDAGYYSCVARNHLGQRDKKSMWLSVIVPPRIEPFTFPRETREGLRARLLCSVIDGDSPIRITWLKDEQAVPSVLDIVIQKTDDFSSLMTFKSVTKKHNGNYSCVATNSAGRVAHTAELQVQVPPYWIAEPKDNEELLGKNAIIDCQASGFPPPNISWMKGKGKSPGSYAELHSYGIRHHVFTNGSLLIGNVQKSDEGYYLCQATNGIGSGQSKVVFLRVNVPAHFVNKTSTSTAHVGQEARLTCEATGDKPMKIQWSINGKRIDVDSDQRFNVKHHEQEDGLLSALTLHQTRRGDGALFQCYATNAHGHDEASVRLTVQEQPGQPTNLIVVNVAGRNATLSWKQPFNGNDPINAFILQYKRITESWEKDALNYTVHGAESTATVNRLAPGTPYHVRVIAVNSVGASRFSDQVDVTTIEEEPGGPPLAVEAKALTSESVKITWKPPKREAWNGMILGYYVGYRTYDSNEAYKYKTVEVNPNTDMMDYQLTHLKKYTKYSIVVNAFNRMGRGPPSDEVIAVTSEDAPDEPPQEVTCASLSSQSIQVTWSPPPLVTQNGVILGYKVFYALVSDWEDEEARHVTASAVLKVNLHTLHKYSNYSIQVLAYNRAGEGTKSESIFCRTQEDVPGAPGDIKALVMTSDCILITWMPPKYSNGNLIKYTLYMRNAESRQPPAVKHISSSSYDLSFEARGLKENLMHEFWITASTVIGEGESTRVVKQASQSKVIAQIASFSRKIFNKWKGTSILPCRAVGLPTPTKRWFFRGFLVAENSRIFSHPDGSLEIRELSQNDSGNFTCEVDNIYGKDSISYLLVVQAPPSSPSILVAGVAATSLQLKIQPPLNTKGSVKGYTLTYRREFSDWEEIEIDKDDEIITLENLRCGSLYHLFMTAFNKVGAGEPSDIVQVATRGAAPKVRKMEDVLSANVTFLVVHLRDWPDGGCPVTYFILKYKRVEANEWLLVSNKIQPQQGDFLVPDLTPATWYSVELTTHNAAGFAVAQYSVATLTTDGVTISPNTAPNIDGSGASIILDWNIVVPVAAAITIVTAVLFLGVCIVVRRRKYRGYHNSYSNASAINHKMAFDQHQTKPTTGTRNSIELALTPTPARKHHDSAMTRAHDNTGKASPYTHFQHSNNRQETVISSLPLDACNELSGNVQDYIQRIPTTDDIIDARMRRRITHLTKTNDALNGSSMTNKDNGNGVGCQPQITNANAAAFQVVNDQQLQVGDHVLIYPGDEYDDSAASDSDGGVEYYTESVAQLHDRCRVPDLLFHGTDSSTSNDTSPDNERRMSRSSRSEQLEEQCHRYPLQQMAKQDITLYMQESHSLGLAYSESNEMSEAECDRDFRWSAAWHEQQQQQQHQPPLLNCNHNRLSGRPPTALIKTYELKSQLHQMDEECCNGCVIRV